MDRQERENYNSMHQLACLEIERLRAGIQAYLDGDYGRKIPRKIDTCKHNLYRWEACENCIDEYFAKLLNGSQ